MLALHRSMKILLTTLNAKYIHLNLAIRLLYVLNKHKSGLEWREFVIKQKPEEIAEACKEYDVIAFSCYIWNITQTLSVARELKKINPNIKILLGGPEVSYDYEEFILKEEVDFIIIGEGEIPFAAFLDHYPDVTTVSNLVYKQDGKVRFNQQQVPFDLKNYTGINPYLFDTPEELYNKVSYIETSRGCPYKCEFCLASLDNKVRYLPIEDIKSNLLYLMQNGRVIKFLDRTFNVKKDFTIDIFKFILQNHKPGNIFQFEITADIVHPDIVKFIQEHVPPGLFRFEIGIQTVNQKANLAVSRKQNFEKTSAVIKQLDNKIEMHLDLIVGLPYDEWSDIKLSVEEVFKLFPSELQLGFLKFLRGTPMRKKSDEHGYLYDPLPPYQLIESKYLSKTQLQQITILEEALEIYWNKKRAVNTLQYIAFNYSIFDFLLELGNYFIERKDFHRHSLDDVYDILFDFVINTYSEDNVVKQLVAVDYFLHYKIKPKARYINELTQQERNKVIELNKLNHHQYRFAMLPLTFNLQNFLQKGKISDEPQVLTIQYNGKEKPVVLNTTPVLTI